MPIITSKNNAKVEELNNKFEALGNIFDRLEKVPAASADPIITNLSNWQDWYWGNYESWPINELSHWNNIYNETVALIEQAKAKTIIQKEVVIAKPKVQTPVIIKEEDITADIPWFWYLIPITFIGSLAAALYTVFKKEN